MYFSPKGSRLYLSLISRPKYIWNLLTISICLLFFSAWWVFLNKPINKILKSQISTINNLKVELDRNADKKSDFINNNNLNNSYDKNFEKRSLEERLSQLKSEFKENSGVDKIIKIIEEASKSGLKVKLYDFKPELKKTWYSKYIFELDLVGNFETITRFMEKINKKYFKLKFFDFIAKPLTNGLINLKMTIQMLDIKNENA